MTIQNYNKRYLFVNVCFALQRPISGASVRSRALLGALHECGKVDVISFGVDNETDEIACGDRVFLYDLPPSFPKKPLLDRIEKLFFLFRIGDIYSYFPRNSDMERIIDLHVEKERYDFIIVRYIFQACQCGLIKYGKKLIIDIDDSPADLLASYKRIARTKRQKMFLSIQSKFVGMAMKHVSKKVYHLFYSNYRQAVFPNSSYLHNITPINNHIGPASYSSTDMTMIMVADFMYFPNLLGLKHFIECVFPKVKQTLLQIELVLAGKMDDEQKQTLLRTEGIRILGFVEDLSEAYRKVRISVIPIYDGAGTSIKTIETMMMQRPCVTTSFGVRGLLPSFIEGVDYLLAEDDEKFAQYIVDIVTDESLNHKIAMSAYEKVRKEYSIDNFSEKVSKIIS